MRLALIGYGNVAKSFARLLEQKRSAYPFRIVGAHTRHGTALSDKGLPLEPEFHAPLPSIEEFLDAARPEVVFELTTLNPESGEPALSYVRSAFSRGMHVITANKGPVAFAYAELAEEARRAGVCFRHETVTMDGTPVFNMVRNNLPGVNILGFAGALNSTSKVVIETMRTGRSYQEGIEAAQRLGVAEADASFDTEGWDSAAKAAALANVLMNAKLTPRDVDRRGIGRLDPEKLADLRSKQKTVVLVSRAHRTSSGVKLRVRAEVLPENDPLAMAQGTSNLLLLETDLMGTLGIFSVNPGVEQTAYGLFADLVDIARES